MSRKYEFSRQNYTSKFNYTSVTGVLLKHLKNKHENYFKTSELACFCLIRISIYQL